MSRKKQHQQPFEVFLNHKISYIGIANYFMACIVESEFIFKCLLYILILNSNTLETQFDYPFDTTKTILLYTGLYNNHIAVNYICVDKTQLLPNSKKISDFAKILCTTGPYLITKVYYDNIEYKDKIDVLISSNDDRVGSYGKHHYLGYCY